MLVIFAGLPGVGKSTVAQALARDTGAVYLRIDRMEQAMRDAGFADEEIAGAGYGVAQAVARDNLGLGRLVVVDSVNPWQLTRDAYRQVALDAGVGSLDVEIVCTNPEVHRLRVETRVSEVAGLVLPTWSEVLGRDYHAWDIEPLRLDSAHLSIEEMVGQIRSFLRPASDG